MKYQSKKIADIAPKLIENKDELFLTGKKFTAQEMNSVLNFDAKIHLAVQMATRTRIKKASENVEKQVREGVAIYGVNTAFGGNASLILNSGSEEERLTMARQISEAAIHVDVSTGPAVPKHITKLAMAIRVNMLIRGVSGVRYELLETLLRIINENIIPKVGTHGGLGASGDLPQNGRVLSLLIHPDEVSVWGDGDNFADALPVLQAKLIDPISLAPKEGLALINGDNFSTASAFHLVSETTHLLLAQLFISSMMYEMLLSTNRSLHPMISKVRPHEGQKEVAYSMRKILNGSGYIRNEFKRLLPPEPGRKIQDVYSIRCIPQFLGVDLQKVKIALETVEINANSVSDNPLWVPDDLTVKGEEPWQWVSGGNFLAMYMVDVMDDMRKIITHTVKLNDRHLSRLIDPHENNGLPANLSSTNSLSQCVFKGVQAQAGMLEVYSTFLASPISTLFGVHEQNNQDITSHAMTSGILGRQDLVLAHTAQAQLLLALAQAVDLREGPDKLSPATQKIYEFVRERAEFVDKEMPLGKTIEKLAHDLQQIHFRKLIVSLLK